MKYIELYKKQLGDEAHLESVYASEYFQAYCNLNGFLNDYYRTTERLKEIVLEDIEALTIQELKAIEDSATVIKEHIHKLEDEEHVLLKAYPIEGVVLMLGDGTVDAHGLMVNDKAYLIVDLVAYGRALDKYNPTSFLVHEITHAVHYHLNPEMYFKGVKEHAEGIFKRMLVEGIATYASELLTHESEADIFWLGYLDQEAVNRWKDYALKEKIQFSGRLSTLIKDGTWCDAFQYKLFSIDDPEKLWQGRLAYFYGYEIAKKIAEKSTLDDLLKMRYSDLMKALKTYFSIEDVRQ